MKKLLYVLMALVVLAVAGCLWKGGVFQSSGNTADTLYTDTLLTDTVPVDTLLMEEADTLWSDIMWED